jgi:hypothetical protein
MLRQDVCKNPPPAAGLDPTSLNTSFLHRTVEAGILLSALTAPFLSGRAEAHADDGRPADGVRQVLRNETQQVNEVYGTYQRFRGHVGDYNAAAILTTAAWQKPVLEQTGNSEEIILDSFREFKQITGNNQSAAVLAHVFHTSRCSKEELAAAYRHFAAQECTKPAQAAGLAYASATGRYDISQTAVLFERAKAAVGDEQTAVLVLIGMVHSDKSANEVVGFYHAARAEGVPKAAAAFLTCVFGLSGEREVLAVYRSLPEHKQDPVRAAVLAGNAVLSDCPVSSLRDAQSSLHGRERINEEQEQLLTSAFSGANVPCEMLGENLPGHFQYLKGALASIAVLAAVAATHWALTRSDEA